MHALHNVAVEQAKQRSTREQRSIWVIALPDGKFHLSAHPHCVCRLMDRVCGDEVIEYDTAENRL
jgi:hypothetical protein